MWWNKYWKFMVNVNLFCSFIRNAIQNILDILIFKRKNSENMIEVTLNNKTNKRLNLQVRLPFVESWIPEN